MKSEFYPIIRFILFISLMVSVAGCGSSGSTATTGTGGIAVKLVWNASNSTTQAKSAEKALLLAPAGVVKVRIIVSGPGMTEMRQDFLVADYPSGGTMNGIPAGTGRTVKAQGLDAAGLVFSEGKASNPITIQTGLVNDAGTITMSDIVKASPPGGTFSSSVPLFVNLSASTGSAATIIYYTTNGLDPTASGFDIYGNNVHRVVGRSPIRNILISGSHTFLKFFANFGSSDDITPIKSEEYSISP